MNLLVLVFNKRVIFADYEIVSVFPAILRFVGYVLLDHVDLTFPILNA